MLPVIESIVRIIAAALAGFLIGLARRQMPAGPRTFALICLGCTVFTLLAFIIDGPNTDPTRIIAQVVTGIGFIGVGVIWKDNGDRPAGLTTAAAIWVTAAVGILIGLGEWVLSVGTAILAIAIIYSKPTLKKAKLEGDE
jgi:putative Mg2+ transporter-C (MgtC) family protein